MNTQTDQQIYDRVATHLIKQGKAARVKDVPASSSLDSCLYLAPDGTRCAVGCLMRTDPASCEAASKLMGTVYAVAPQLCALLDFEPTDGQLGGILTELQHIHDRRENLEGRSVNDYVQHWPARLQALANKFGLDDSVVARALAELPEGHVLHQGGQS